MTSLEKELTIKSELHMNRFHASLSEARQESGYYDLELVKHKATWYGLDFITSPVTYNNALTSIKIFLQGFESITVTAK